MVGRIQKKIYYLSEMLFNIIRYVPSPAVPDKSNNVQNLSVNSVKVRCFRSFSPASNPKTILVTESKCSSSSVVANRVSRLAQREAQAVLFDYLHNTRGFEFADAEYISQNSPTFIHNLLSKIENKQDVSRTLSKFLRYNPINEFAPFFESLGLNLCEYSSLLPQNMMFLGDDHILLNNFHVLCHYGIPRIKIGKMYKEVTKIFRYDKGILDSKLLAFEELGLSSSTVIKLVSCCPSLLIEGGSSVFFKVLEKLKRLGFETNWIEAHISGDNDLNWNRVIDTMDFLDKAGYTHRQMECLFRATPELLFEGSGKNIYVLIGRLLKLGLDMKHILSLIVHHPQILSRNSEKNLWQAVSFLLEIGFEVKGIATIVSTHTELLCSCSLKSPKIVLKSMDIDKDGLCQIIKQDQLKLFSLASKSNNSKSIKHVEKANFLSKLGYLENSDEMAKALKKFRGRGDELQERFDCLVLAGLDYNAVSSMIKLAPPVLNQTKDVIEKKIDCLRNCLGYPLESVIGFPTYLCYDIERINLRFSMYVWLRDKGVAKPMLSLSTILACSDARFIKYFVNVHPEGPAMWESLKKASFSASLQAER